MPAPYERPPSPHFAEMAAHPSGPPAQPTVAAPRPPLTRPAHGRLIAGVCAGIGAHLGIRPLWVRLLIILLTFAGPGLPVYLFVWATTPAGDPQGWASRAAYGEAKAPLAARAVAGVTESRWGFAIAVGGAFVVVGLSAALYGAGVDTQAGALFPLLLIAVGVALAWSRLDDSERASWLGGGAQDRRAGWLRLGVGLLLAVVGILIFTVRGSSLAAMGNALIAALAVLVGVGVIGAPWVRRLWRDYRDEQEVAARANERADIAAHLHDSVLQTLALIQRQSGSPVAVSQLARAQERELRTWLYAAPAGSDETLAAAVVAAAHDVEDLSGVPIDLVVTGDRQLEEHGTALVRAMREAMLNATRHGEAPVTAYAEIGPGGVEAFVRDRGTGFEVSEIPQDRLGVRNSILARMERHGGHAQVRRRDDGTEVQLVLPPLEGDQA